jgi:hypothetical protein
LGKRLQGYFDEADRLGGVICHGHRGAKRTWNSDEETFAYRMSNFVALALERNTKA